MKKKSRDMTKLDSCLSPGPDGTITADIPRPVLFLIRRLQRAGYEASVIGGSVRDLFLGREPYDWDLCTPARPEEMRRVFSDFHLIGTGEKHGTIGVIVRKTVYEITTYRIDGAYTDSRHPDSVTFSRDLEEDLARRDFTVNAMALVPEPEELRNSAKPGSSPAAESSRPGDPEPDAGGPGRPEERVRIRCRLVDPFDGLGDLRRGVIRAVGDPEARLREDALRIMRAYRFSAVLGFPLEDRTERACDQLADTVGRVSAERVLVEMEKLLLGRDASAVVRRYRAPLERAVGMRVEADEMLEGLGRMAPELPVRFAGLFGPRAEGALKRLKAPKKLIRGAGAVWKVYEEIEGAPGGCAGLSRQDLKRLLRKAGADAVRGALSVEGALARRGADRAAEEVEEILAKECWSLGQLQVSGKDLTERGLRGPEVGATLDRLLNAVIDGTCPNEKEALLRYAGL